MKKYTYIILLTIMGLSVQAQDMLISKKGDTLRGKINVLTSRQGVESLTIKVNRKKQAWRLLDVKEYYRKGERYVTLFALGQYRIGKFVSDHGYVTKYLYSPTSFDQKPPFSQLLLVKQNGDHIEVPKALLFRKTLARFMDDCSSVSEGLRDKAYDRSQLDFILRDYSDCILAAKSHIEKVETLESKLANLREVLKTSDKIENKQEVRQMLKDLDEKVKAKEPIPDYLKTALSNALRPDLRLSSLLLEIFDF